MRYISLTFLLILAVSALKGQVQRFDTIQLHILNQETLRTHLEILASDSLEGRATGSKGSSKAANYIANEFKNYGLQPYKDSSFFQSIDLWQWQWTQSNLQTPNQSFGANNICYLSSEPINDTLKAPCIFINDPSDENITTNAIKGKIVVTPSDNLRFWFFLAQRLKKYEPKAILIFNPDDTTQFHKAHIDLAIERQSPSIVHSYPKFYDRKQKVLAIRPSVVEAIWGKPISKLRTLKKKHLKKLPQPELAICAPVEISEVDANNVIGVWPGKNPENGNIVLTAHYDHIGKRGESVCYGADDNASGTAALLHMAEAMTKLDQQPDRTLIFLATTAEERGLLGADFFAKDAKRHQMNIKANLNMDMIGRIDSLGKANYIYTIGREYHPQLDSLVKEANRIDPLEIQYDYDKPRGYINMLRLSDHYAFHQIGVPFVAFFSGLHGDYHTPRDTPDKIDYELMLKRVRLIFITTWLTSQKEAF